VDRFIGVIAGADYVTFLALMITNALLYVAWDTLVLTVAIQWFHGQVRWRDLLPIRAASYVFAVFNTNLGRGALALFLSRVLRQPFLQLGSTVIFLVLTEYTHLVVWATLGVLIFGTAETRALLWVPPAIAAVWLLFFAYARAAKLADARATSGGPITWLFKPWRGALLRTFRLAPARRYVQIIILKAPMFFASLLLHYLAAPAFGMVIPFAAMVTFLPVIFMVAALPITVARLGSTQGAWLLLFGAYAAPEQILAFSLAAHLTFVITRALIGVLLSQRVWSDLVTPAAQTAVLAGIPRARM
jgi:uncharacterized membrane protein YbhN (UPF0104 family)